MVETDLEELFAYAAPEEVFDKLGVLGLLVDLFGARCQNLREVLWTGAEKVVYTTNLAKNKSERSMFFCGNCNTVCLQTDGNNNVFQPYLRTSTLPSYSDASPLAALWIFSIFTASGI